jgi:putative alpha-1,2-mannosidase
LKLRLSHDNQLHAGFMQKRFPNGTFAPGDPADCSPEDQQQSRECSLQSDNTVGLYESSSWEYSWFAPHDTVHLITLMGGSVSKYLLGFAPSFKNRDCTDTPGVAGSCL